MGVVAVDVTGLPVGALGGARLIHENRANRVMLDHLAAEGVIDRARSWSSSTAGSRPRRLAPSAASMASRSAGSAGTTISLFWAIRHAWRVEVAHGRLDRSRRLANSFENTTTSDTG